ncbi:MAG: response regulator [Verrucomicrobia bacterium]|nr:response regulator [Verrucomicrobiota bacterium]MBU1735214.1 response regulator [Verrucomicrobiota bacterium]
MKIENCRVAIADDEAMIRYALKSVIKDLKMSCVGEAMNGQEAVALYAKEQPDLMLLDINMPAKNGDEALKEIRAKFPDANVVMLTSVAETETVKKCVQDGAINYILKTNPLDKIKIMIEEIVKNL